jgi:hypothetical protein
VQRNENLVGFAESIISELNDASAHRLLRWPAVWSGCGLGICYAELFLVTFYLIKK